MSIVTKLVASFAMVLSVGGVAAQPYPPGVGPKCLSIYDVKTTKAIDPGTVLFRMRDGSVWANHLHGRCNGLKYYGFVYRTTDEQICANAQSIRVQVSQETCLLGDFSP